MKLSRFARSPLAAVVAAGLMVVGPAMPAIAAPPGSGAGDHCVVAAGTTTLTCFDTFREAVAAATGGRVADAPENVAKALEDPEVTAKLNNVAPGEKGKAPTTASSGGTDRSRPASGAAADPTVRSTPRATNDPLAGVLERPGSVGAAANVILGIAWVDGWFTGASLTFYGARACTAWVSTGFPRLQGQWNDSISSFKTYNGCGASWYKDWDYGGAATARQFHGDVGWIGDDLNDQAGSVKFDGIVNIDEMLKDCGGAAGCEFVPQGNLTYWTTHQTNIGHGVNCASTTQTVTAGIHKTTGGSHSVGTEVNVGVEFAEIFKASVSLRYGREWSWSDTLVDSATLHLAPNRYGWVNRNAAMMTAEGQWQIRYGSPKWGHYHWYLNNYRGHGPNVALKKSGYTFHDRAMTAQERVNNGCAPNEGGHTSPIRSSAHAGFCVDIPGANGFNGARIQLWSCNGTPAQQWSRSGRSITVMGRCLDVEGWGTGNGTPVQLWDCTGGGNQQWDHHNGGFRNAHSGKCLDLPGNNPSPGNKLTIYDCHGGPAQRWSAGF
ncbi:RICIN domain-containing protein [Rhizohabitans arisaemae]|uniref:RICIN domain-containing protein n=1 Tax=Rhizohabitans arisaemae TaxID=2720610 RepID=UPI0024B073C6|nr:RICIN domain-containing protein [Rhizohabitans arisaemae]